MIKTITKLLIIAMVLMGPVSTYAQTDGIFNGLVVAEDLSQEERLAKKIELATSALSQALNRAEEIEADLNALEFEEESKELSMKEVFLTDIAIHKDFYSSKLSEMEKTQSLEGVNTLIQEVITYRENIYSPAISSTLEFVLIFSYGPEALETANNRLNKIEEDLGRLVKLGLIEEIEFSSFIEEAKEKLSEAEELQNWSVLKMLGEGLTVVPSNEIGEGETALETQVVATSTEEISPSTEEIVEVDEPAEKELNLEELEPRDLAEKSLQMIKEAYTLFIEAGNKIRTALGINPEEKIIEEDTQTEERVGE